MPKSLDSFLDRKYNRTSYNCLHFSRDVWLFLTGVDITEALQTVFDPNRRTGFRRTLSRFRLLNGPEDPCLVMMHRPRVAPHIGVFVRGKVIHLHDLGVEYLPVEIASRGFSSVRYYTCR